jgi:glucosyl-3-phosphoglycerate synthase
MAAEIAVSLFRTLAADGSVLGPDHLRTLEVAYVRSAEDMVESYSADALLNGLDFDRSAEESAVAAFVYSLRDAAAQFLADPLGSPPLASWARVTCAVPGIRQLLLEPADEFEGAAAVA